MEDGYDEADQLVAAVEESTDTTPVILRRLGSAYDPAGNRTVEQVDDAVSVSAYSNMNRWQTKSPGGRIAFLGSVSEPATVTIQGQAASVDSSNQFRGDATMTAGSNNVAIVATDSSGNQTTREYQVDVTGQTKSFTFDANGNLTSDGTRGFEWDARNQLVAVTAGNHRSEFGYDGLQRRVRVVEKANGVTQTDTRVICCEPRDL